METARKEMADNANARAQIYGLLAAIFRAEPSEALINELKAPAFVEIFSNLGLTFGDEFYQTPSQDLTEDLAIEYAKLFIGPGPHISPHESIIAEVQGSEGGLWGKKTVEVKKFIESAGFNYEPKFTGLPDHVSAELEFMQKLAETQAGLLSEGEAERADWCQRVQKKFIDEHLVTWVPKLCDAIVEKAEIPFYAQIAEITKSFLEFDQRIVNGSLSEPV